MAEVPMKVAVGSKSHDGPWGGGNRFIESFCDALKAAGHQVVHDLSARDIEIILIVDPRWRSPHVCFGAGDALRYLAFRNPKAIVVHRINECDERKGEPFINHKLVRANYAADATVFVGEWLTRLPVWRENLRSPWFVIRNGADTRIFNANGFKGWPGTGPIKLVTHHWGYHPMKGFDVYSAIDKMLGDPEWRARLEFTYIGQLPPKFSFANARYVPPLNGTALADELRRHQAYLTASINEPGGNHQVEGALCGLPLIYRDSGCMPEYCAGFGIPFSGPEDFPAAFNRLIAEYAPIAARIPSYPNTAQHAMDQWIDLLQSLLRDREQIGKNRKIWRDPWAAFSTQVIL